MDKNYEWVYEGVAGFKKRALPRVSKLRPNEVLVKPLYVGICGTDQYLIRLGLADLRLGHEWVGRVLVGDATKKFFAGDLVTGTGHFACGKCSHCKKGESNFCLKATHFSSHTLGALRSEFVAPADQIQKLEGAPHPSLALHEVFAVGEEAFGLLSASIKKRKPKQVLVFGAGPIGLAVALVLKSRKVDCLIIERLPERVRKAKAMRLKAITLTEALFRSELRGRFSVLVDTTNDYSGDAGAFRLLPVFSSMSFTALLVGKYTKPQTLTPPYNSMAGELLWMHGVSNKTMKSSIKRWQKKLAAISKNFISHVYDVSDCDEAFAMAANKSLSAKVVISLF